jgi:hypothetical protein
VKSGEMASAGSFAVLLSAMADDSPKKEPLPSEYEFVLRVITPDGKNVYSVDAIQLAQVASLQPLTQNDTDAAELLRLTAPIAHVPFPEHAALFGTFLVNLSVFNPDVNSGKKRGE